MTDTAVGSSAERPISHAAALDPSTPIPSPPSSKNIPTEVLAHVLTYLAHSDVVAFALASRAFFRIANAKLWAELDIDLLPHWGEHPEVQPFAEDHPDHDAWLAHTNTAAELRRGDRLRERVKRITLQLGTERPSEIRSISTAPRYQAYTGIANLLAVASPKLRKLEIRASPEGRAGETETRYGSTFAFVLNQADSLFLSLTHLTISHHPLSNVDEILRLCLQAPNLLHLDAAIGGPMRLEAARATSLQARKTKLQHLRLSLRDISPDPRAYEYPRTVPPPLISLISSSPGLRQVSIQHPKLGYSIEKPLFHALGRLRGLEELHWAPTLKASQWLHKGEVQIFPSLRRLVLECVAYPLASFYLPAAPVLETLHIIDCVDGRDWEPLAFELPLEIPHLRDSTHLPKSAEHIRKLPRLHMVYNYRGMDIGNDLDMFARLGVSATSKLRVRSLRRGDQELIHVAYLPTSEVVRPPDPSRVRPRGPRGVTSSTPRMDGSYYTQEVYYNNPADDWHMLDWGGKAVPLDVVQAMARLQDDLGEWRRGIEIGDEAWAVLQKWNKTATAAQNTEDVRKWQADMQQERGEQRRN